MALVTLVTIIPSGLPATLKNKQFGTDAHTGPGWSHGGPSLFIGTARSSDKHGRCNKRNARRVLFIDLGVVPKRRRTKQNTNNFLYLAILMGVVGCWRIPIDGGSYGRMCGGMSYAICWLPLKFEWLTPCAYLYAQKQFDVLVYRKTNRLRRSSTKQKQWPNTIHNYESYQTFINT